MLDERKSKEEIISENILSRIFSLIPISEPLIYAEEEEKLFYFDIDQDLRSFMSLAENVRSMLHQHV